MCLSKMCFPPRAGSKFYKQWQKNERKGIEKHEKQKENRRSHTTLEKLQSFCRRSFLQTGLGGEKRTRLEPQAVFEGDMERAHSEANEQQSDKSKHNLQKLIILKPFGGQKRDIFHRKYSKSFFKIVLAMQARSTFFKKCDAKSELDHKNHEGGILKLAFLMQSRIKSWGTWVFCSSLGTG